MAPEQLPADSCQVSQELHNIMILRHGQVIAEASWHPNTPDRPHILFSLSKSFTSTAVGFAVAEGRLTLDDPFISFFIDEIPDKLGRYWSEHRVRHLLSINTGHDTDTTIFMLKSKDGNWVLSFFGRPLRY